MAIPAARSTRWSVLAVLCLVIGWAPSAMQAAGVAAEPGDPGVIAAPAQFPPGPGQARVQLACGPCHAITVVTSARKSESEWERTVSAMITRGARISDEDFDVILDYLIANFSAP